MSRNTRLALAATAAIAATSILIGTQIVSGQSTAQETVFVPVVPCRLVDTRPAANNIGPIATKIGAGQTVTFNAHNGSDANSTCQIPATATAIATNATAIAPTAATFITLYPGNATNPGTSNLNVLGGAAPTPNSVNVPLAPNGTFNVFNNAGNVNIAIDINGYYQPSTNIGTPGTPGTPGTNGTNGTNGDRGPAGTNGTNGTNGAPNRITNQQIAQLQWWQDPGREARIAVGADPYYVATDGTNIYVSNFEDDTVSIIDPTTNTVTNTITVGEQPAGMAYDGTYIYVTSYEDNAVSIIDPNNLPTPGMPAPTFPVGDFPEYIAYDGSRLYVTNYRDHTVSIIDPNNPPTDATPAPTFPVGQNPYGIVYDGTNLYVVNSGDDSVSIIDPNNPPTVAAPAPTFPVVGAALIIFDGTNLYLASAGDPGSVKVIDPNNPPTVAAPAPAITVPRNPYDMTYDGTNIYVVNSTTVSVIDPTTNTVIRTINLPPGDNPAGGVAFDGTNIWVAGPGDFVTKIIPG